MAEAVPPGHEVVMETARLRLRPRHVGGAGVTREL